MDELPKEARALLALAKDGHDPPDGEARARVRAKLALAFGATAAGAGASSAAPGGAGKALWGSWLHAKGWLVASVLSVGAVGTSVALLQPPRVAQRPAASTRHVAPAVELAPVAEPPPSAMAPAHELAAESKPAAAKPSARPRSAAPAGAGLAEETELLGRAARLLAQRDAAGARQLLVEHRKRFARSQLREERDGLSVLARCVEDPSSAGQEARSFVTAAPASVLVARIEKACGLGRAE